MCRGKVLVLYKNKKGRFRGWVLPKGTLEPGETTKQAALREVKEESGVDAKLLSYVGRTHHSFMPQAGQEKVSKTVHWYLMTTDSFDCVPQREEYFADAGFYKQHEAYHLLKYPDERQILRRAFVSYKQYGNNI